MKALGGALFLVVLMTLLLYAANWVMPTPTAVTPKRVIGAWVISVIFMLLVHTAVVSARGRK